MRVAGTIGGGITGIIVWEISRGNPYGIGVLCFFISIGSYYVFIFKVKYRVMAMLYTVTMLLVSIVFISCASVLIVWLGDRV